MNNPESTSGFKYQSTIPAIPTKAANNAKTVSAAEAIANLFQWQLCISNGI